MLFTRTLSSQEVESLHQLSRSYETIIHRRSRIILLSAQRRSANEIAEVVGLHPNSIRLVIRSFNENGIDSISSKAKSGRLRAFGTDVQDKIVELLRHKPTDYGIESGVWTLEEAAKVAVEQGIVGSICIESLLRSLKSHPTTTQRSVP
ncbi:MAG: helix-turn-helix domain-containing protein [Armatimonadota bacterium]